jgi:transposase
VELYRKVRHAYFRQGMSKRAIARHFGISRDSVDKMIVYSVPPGYRRTAPVKRPKLDGFTEIIDRWLREDVDRPRKQRHTAKRVLDRLREEHGVAGGYTIVKSFVREHQRRRRDKTHGQRLHRGAKLEVPQGVSVGALVPEPCGCAREDGGLAQVLQSCFITPICLCH